MRRKRILDIIEKNPGIGFNEISRQTELSNGVISHHILQLLKDDRIVRIGIRAKYFEIKIPERDRKLIAMLSNSTNLKIAKILLEKGPVKSKIIVKMSGKSASTISINIKKMEKEKIISRKILNEDSKLTSDIGFHISNKKFLIDFISKYNLT